MPSGIFYSVLVSSFGCRKMAILGSILTSLGVSLSSLAFNIPWMYATYGVVAGKSTHA